MAYDSTETEVGTWHTETVLKRLDRSRRFLFGQGIITPTVNDAVRTSLEESRDLELQAEQDDLAKSLYEAFDEAEEGDSTNGADDEADDDDDESISQDEIDALFG